MTQTNRLTSEQLLQPRYEVIADYPGSDLPIGTILLESKLGYCFREDVLTTSSNIIATETVTKYPHLFRRLNWWEHRTPEEMPEYLRRKTKDAKVFKAKKHGVEATHSLGFIDENDRILSYCNFLPATLQDYTQYITNLNANQ